jgi:hypothetical protein
MYMYGFDRIYERAMIYRNLIVHGNMQNLVYESPLGHVKYEVGPKGSQGGPYE